MKAADIMTTPVVTINPDATAQQAAELMLRHHISALPVVDDKGKLVGLVSEGDLVRRAELGTAPSRSWWLELFIPHRKLAREYAKVHGRKVSELMTRKVTTAMSGTPISEIALLLEKHGIKRVPIVDQGKLAGIVTRANLVQALAGMAAEQPASPPRKDAEIRDEALKRLWEMPWHPWLVNVTVREGVADLWGIVNSSEEKTAAGVVVENTPGMVKVNNHIIVRPHSWAEAKPYFDESGSAI
jgi:CBS domain-containing protein